MSDEFVENLKKPSAWFRVLFMAGFVVALYVVSVVLLVLVLAQILFSLISGSDNINLRRLGAGLTQYVTQILSFLTYNSEEKPFPFAPFPLPEDSNVAVSDAYAEYSADPTSADPTPAEPTSADPASSSSTSAESVAAKPAASKATATKATEAKPVAAEPSAAASTVAGYAAADAPQPAPEHESSPALGEPLAPAPAKAKARRSRSGTASSRPRKSSAKKPVKSADDISELKDDV